MLTVQQILADADARYRNTYTQAQKILWLNLVYRQIYKKLKKETQTELMFTVVGEPFYALPSYIEPKDIQRIDIQRVTTEVVKEYYSLDYRHIEDVESAEFYSIIRNTIFLFPTPTLVREMMIYFLAGPEEITESNLSMIPDLPNGYEEILIIGLLERIAGARKDIVMKNNYMSDYMVLMGDLEFETLSKEPDYTTPRDELPRIRRR